MTDSAVDRAPDQRGRNLRITTGARLHFGLLRTSEPFGGVGAILDDPATEIVVSESREFRCDDPHEGSRIYEIAKAVSRAAGRTSLPSCQIKVVSRPRSHCGLGSGTQLALAVAEAICNFIAFESNQEAIAIEIAGRGKRSAVGVHGYFHGGLIHEESMSGQRDSALNPICQRVELPESWSALIVRPSTEVLSVSGDFEREQFATLKEPTEQQIVVLRELVSQRMMPAARDRDFAGFAEAVQAYNRKSGMLFESVQGGPYNGQAVTDLVDTLIDMGAKGVGQSSWGPGVFCWFESKASANAFVGSLPSKVELLTISQSRSTPRSIQVEL